MGGNIYLEIIAIPTKNIHFSKLNECILENIANFSKI